MLVAAAFLTYLFDPEDVVWHFVKGSSTHSHAWERALFAGAALLLGISAVLCTWARAKASAIAARESERVDRDTFSSLSAIRHFGDLLYAFGLGTLAPRSGFVLLVFGEGLRIFLIMQRERKVKGETDRREVTNVVPVQRSRSSPFASSEMRRNWFYAFRLETIKWGLFLTMVIFTATLSDRLAEVLAVASFLVGVLMNGKEQLRGDSWRHHPDK